MHRFRLSLCLTAAFAALTSFAGAGAHDGDEVVARVGAVTITRAELESRIAAGPRSQLAVYGATPAEQRRGFLEKSFVRDALFAQGAHARALAERPEVHVKVLGAMRAALQRGLESDVAMSSATSDDAVARYYEQNKARFEQPPRVHIWRIGCATKEEAQQVLDEAKKPGGEKAWAQLARDKSQDKATAQRGGDIGFIGPDGQSNEAPVRVEPALYAAASKVKDGELVPEPVPEAKMFAVVWRRGSIPALTHPLAQEAAGIRALLARQRLESMTKEMLERLRREHVTEVAEDLVDVVEVKKSGEITPRPRPGVSAPRALGRPQPSATPAGGLRLGKGGEDRGARRTSGARR